MKNPYYSGTWHICYDYYLTISVEFSDTLGNDSALIIYQVNRHDYPTTSLVGKFCYITLSIEEFEVNEAEINSKVKDIIARDLFHLYHETHILDYFEKYQKIRHTKGF